MAETPVTWTSKYPDNPQYRKMTSFSGTDIMATITVPGWATGGKDAVFVVGSLQTISYSIHRDKFPVRTLGRINPAGFAFGPRTIAGSLIFTVFDRNIVHHVKKLLAESAATRSSVAEKWKYPDVSSAYSIMDEMPPFDVTLSFVNEYGAAAKMKILGVVVTDEGQTMSIEDMITENTMTYLAHDIIVMTPEGND